MSAVANRAAVGVSLAAVIALAGPTVSKWEGYANDPYRDQAGILTVCRGETAGIQNRRYSDAECDAMFRQSLKKHASPILACLPSSAPLSVLAAFVSLGYNIGIAAACGSSAAKKVRAGDFRGACNGILAWNKLRHWRTKQLVFSQGLANRRADERALCLSGLR